MGKKKREQKVSLPVSVALAAERKNGGEETHRGQIDTITIHMLGRRSPFQSH